MSSVRVRPSKACIVYNFKMWCAHKKKTSTVPELSPMPMPSVCCLYYTPHAHHMHTTRTPCTAIPDGTQCIWRCAGHSGRPLVPHTTHALLCSRQRTVRLEGVYALLWTPLGQKKCVLIREVYRLICTQKVYYCNLISFLYERRVL